MIFQIPNTLVPPTYVTARNPSVPAEIYSNKINGKIVLWNQKSSQLTLVSDKQPISDDYTSAIVEGAQFTRNASTDSQDDDIFRIGDLLSYEGQPGDEQEFIEVSKVMYSNGETLLKILSLSSSSIASM